MPLERWLPEHGDRWVVLLLGALLLAIGAPILGVWEPWEADRAAVIDAMRERGNWLQIRFGAGEAARVVPELPYGWWPTAALTSLFGTSALSLRLPGLLIGLLTLWTLFTVLRPLTSRLSAWLATLALLTMPLWVMHTRLSIGAGLGTGFIALSTLAFIRLLVDPTAGRAWQWLAWISLAGAGLVLGVPGLAPPLLAAAVGAFSLRGAGPDRVAWSRLAPPLAVGVCAALIGVGWWRAAAHQPEGGSLSALFLWADNLAGPGRGADRPTFEAFVHQIGFGLFPLGALLPLAFAELLWARPPADAARSQSALGGALGGWFAAGFLVPALALPTSHHAFFLAAPAVAAAVGIYLARVLRSPPQPLLALTTVILLALLDSNLKHETRLIADTVVGGEVDVFPASLSGWSIARLLNMALLGALILYQGGALRHIPRAVRAIAYPARRLRLIDWIPSLLAVVPAALVMGAARAPINALIARPGWGRMLPEVRRVVLFLTLWAISYLVVWALWTWRVRRLEGRRDGALGRLSEHLTGWLAQGTTARGIIVGVLVAWGVFLNGPVAAALTTHFSQKGLLDAYAALSSGAEPLYKYKMPEGDRAFYARDLEALDARRFAELAVAEARVFALIPRDRLAAINDEFRRKANRTVPVVEDGSVRFLLISNQLRDGETDHNPITRALVTELPPEATAAAINFEDQIELIGWALDPPNPRPGSPLKITLFWKATKRISGNWKVFVHIDAPGQRIHGDHDPVSGLYPTSNWAPGDIIRDEHLLPSVKRSVTTGRYTFYAGLFQGNRRMKIKSGPKDNEDRARLGTVRVE